MSYIVKGFQGVTTTRSAPQFNAETGQYFRIVELKGPEVAIRGVEQQLIARGLSYRTDHDGPVWTMWLNEPAIAQDIEEIDRWEIFTESVEKSLFETPDAIDAAIAYDDAIPEGDRTFKKFCEDAIDTSDSLTPGTTTTKLIRTLRCGVTGFQLDLIGIRRTRRFEAYNGPAYQIGLDTSLLLYTTAQLNLPSAVAFAVPSTPSNISDLFKWRWRKRSQRVEIVGSYVEQTIELIFAPWSTLAYTDSGTSLSW